MVWALYCPTGWCLDGRFMAAKNVTICDMTVLLPFLLVTTAGRRARSSLRDDLYRESIRGP